MTGGAETLAWQAAQSERYRSGAGGGAEGASGWAIQPCGQGGAGGRRREQKTEDAGGAWDGDMSALCLWGSARCRASQNEKAWLLVAGR